MKLPALITTDLHLTSNPRDAYRWGLFPWLEEQIRKYKIKTLLILGDLTDAKDYHDSTLVNQIVFTLKALSDLESIEEVVILKGNHDYLKDGHAFFDFLNTFDRIKFVSNFYSDLTPDLAALYLPHTKTPDQDWKKFDFSMYDLIFMHQTLNGAVASNGQKMQGELTAAKLVSPLIQIYSGDIHVPQDIGKVRYIGSPYPVHFGDHYEPRCLLLDIGANEIPLHFKTIKRVAITLKGSECRYPYTGGKEPFWCWLKPGDQVKIKVELDKADACHWDKIRKWIKASCGDYSLKLQALNLVIKKNRRILVASKREQAKKIEHTPEQLVCRFVQNEDMGGDFLDTGLGIIE